MKRTSRPLCAGNSDGLGGGGRSVIGGGGRSVIGPPTCDNLHPVEEDATWTGTSETETLYEKGRLEEIPGNHRSSLPQKEEISNSTGGSRPPKQDPQKGHREGRPEDNSRETMPRPGGRTKWMRQSGNVGNASRQETGITTLTTQNVCARNITGPQGRQEPSSTRRKQKPWKPSAGS